MKEGKRKKRKIDYNEEKGKWNDDRIIKKLENSMVNVE